MNLNSIFTSFGLLISHFNAFSHSKWNISLFVYCLSSRVMVVGGDVSAAVLY